MELDRAVIILLLAGTGIAFSRAVWRGVLHVGEDAPLTVLDRRARPWAFWMFTGFFSLVLTAMIAAATFLP